MNPRLHLRVWLAIGIVVAGSIFSYLEFVGVKRVLPVEVQNWLTQLIRRGSQVELFTFKDRAFFAHTTNKLDPEHYDTRVKLTNAEVESLLLIFGGSTDYRERLSTDASISPKVYLRVKTDEGFVGIWLDLSAGKFRIPDREVMMLPTLWSERLKALLESGIKRERG